MAKAIVPVAVLSLCKCWCWCAKEEEKKHGLLLRTYDAFMVGCNTYRPIFSSQ